MDVERIARKLAPLMPEKIESWLRARQTADPETRSLIDKQIVLTAQRKLGDDRSRSIPLLSLPPEKTSKGEFHLGQVLYETDKWSAGLRREEVIQHLAVYGRSGAGKTNVVLHLVRQFVEVGVPVLILDWKRNGRHLLPLIGKRGRLIDVYTPGRKLCPFPFNPFAAPQELEQHVYTQHVVDVMADAYTLGDGARSVLHRAITAAFDRLNRPPTVVEVLAIVRHEAESSHSKGKSWAATAIRALESLVFSEMTSSSPDEQQNLARRMLHATTIIELDALSQSGRRFLIPLLCLWLYYTELASRHREKLQLVIVVEEAHNVMLKSNSSRETLMDMLLRQCREIGIGMVIVDQHPHLLSAAALGNTYTSICLNLKDPADIQRAAAMSLVEDADKPAFSRLPIGHGIVKLQDRWRHPFVVRFPQVPIDKGAVTDAVLAKYAEVGRNRAALACPANSRPYSPPSPEDSLIPPIPGEDQTDNNPFDAMSMRLLQDVLDHPTDGVRERYQRLGLGNSRGHRLKQKLVFRGWLDESVVPVGNARKVVLRLSEKARSFLAPNSSAATEAPSRSESLPHIYWKQVYAKKLRDAGYSVRIEAPRRGGRVDVLGVFRGHSRGYFRGRTVGVEIATGKSDEVANVRHGLVSGFHEIIVVATDEEALSKVERKLVEAGLLIPGRVRVVLRDSGVIQKARVD